jgi:uncharacterized protein YjiS (DUF1127 family)
MPVCRIKELAMPYAIRPADWGALTPSQKGSLTHQLVRRAHAARARAIGHMLRGWARYLSFRRQRRELLELAAMDDIALRDVGINRFQIGTAPRSRTILGCINR